MDPNSGDERPLKRAKVDSLAGGFYSDGGSAFSFATQPATFDPVYHAAEDALRRLDRNQAMRLFRSHPELGEFLSAAGGQSAPTTERSTSHDTDTATEALVEENKQLEEALNREIEGRQRDKEAAERKIESLSRLCVRVLEQRQQKLENTLSELRKEVLAEDVFRTRIEKDAEIGRLHVLVKNFSETMSSDFKSSVEAAAKMLGRPISKPASNTTQVSSVPSEAEVAMKAAEKQIADDMAAGENEEDEEMAEDDEDGEYKEGGGKKPAAKTGKLYSTDYVNKHPDITFHHRASGRWLVGLPPPDASAFTGVRGPLAEQWKKMREKRDADKPKVPRGEKQTTPKKEESDSKIKLEKTLPGFTKTPDQAHRKIQQLENVVRDLQSKLKELRVKLEEEVAARRKAEAKFESLRNGA